jgi:hypothetical protein
MKPLKLILWVACVVFTLAGIYGVALVSFGDERKGRFASWDIFPHSKGDVIEFNHGSVRHLTCCGDGLWGSYSRRSDGVWIWQLTESHRYRMTPDGKEHPFWKTLPGSVEKVQNTTHDVEVYTAPFGIKMRCKTSSIYNCFLRRRLTRYHPF